MSCRDHDGTPRSDEHPADAHGGHGHSHGSAAEALSAGGRYRRRLAVAAILIGVFFVVELIAALATGSLSLLSDAGHMAADVVTLTAALAATVLAARGDRSGRRSFGLYRLEVFAALLAVVMMLVVAVWVVVEGIGRLGGDAEIQTLPMLIVGALGLIVNLAAMSLLAGGARESLNLRGAYLEVLADTLGSVGVIAAALLVALTGSPLADTIIALAIGAFVAVRAVLLGREVIGVLAQSTPRHLDPAVVQRDLEGLEQVAEVHDLHLWTLTSGMDVCSAHLRLREDADAHSALDAGQQLLRTRHGLEHCTLQIEPAEHRTDAESAW